MITVTGSTGHIGNVLVRELIKRGEEVRLMTTTGDVPSFLRELPLTAVKGDLRDAQAVESAIAGADYVFHLAGIISISSFRDKKLEDVNIGGTQNVVDACLKHKVKRLVYTSSVHALPENPDGSEITENSDFSDKNLFGAYAKTKAAATKVVLAAVKNGLDAVITFPSGVLGPYDYRGSEAGKMISDYASNKLPFYIEGEYNFVDVRDVVAGLILAWEKGKKGEGYMLAGNKMNLSEFFEILMEVEPKMKKPVIKIPIPIALSAAWITERVCKVMGVKPLFTAYAIKVLQSNCNISNKKSQEELGYTFRSIRESIHDAHKWMKENGKIS